MNNCKKCHLNKQLFECHGCQGHQYCKECAEDSIINECKCCNKSIENYKYLCNFCNLLILYHPLCSSCKVRGCYYDSPCYLGKDRKLSRITLRRILRQKINIVFKISQMYVITRNRLYLPESEMYYKLMEHFNELVQNKMNQTGSKYNIE